MQPGIWSFHPISHAVIRLGQALFPLFALALDLPENFFDDKTTNPAAIMRLLHYPPQPAKPLDRILGIGAHTEYVLLLPKLKYPLPCWSRSSNSYEVCVLDTSYQ